MQKIFSVRLDEALLNEMDRVTHRARMTKRQFVEDAIRSRAREFSASPEPDVWEETRGAWNRPGRPATTVRAARSAFRRSIERHHS